MEFLKLQTDPFIPLSVALFPYQLVAE